MFDVDMTDKSKNSDFRLFLGSWRAPQIQAAIAAARAFG